MSFSLEEKIVTWCVAVTNELWVISQDLEGRRPLRCLSFGAKNREVRLLFCSLVYRRLRPIVLKVSHVTNGGSVGISNPTCLIVD